VTSPCEHWAFPTARLGQRAHVYESLASTNDTATPLAADPANAGLVVVARHQTAGRGTHGRAWASRPDSSLLMSLVVAPPLALRRPVVLTAWVAVAVADAVRELTGQTPRIKWPNDLLVGGRKLCGILIEQSAAVVVGLGLNLTQSADDFHAAGLPDATSLAMLTPDAEPRPLREVLGVVLTHLDRRYGQLLGGDLGEVEAAWRAGSRLVGRRVALETADGLVVPGHLRSLSFDAVELDCGEVVPQVWPPERVRGLRPLDDPGVKAR